MCVPVCFSHRSMQRSVELAGEYVSAIPEWAAPAGATIQASKSGRPSIDHTAAASSRTQTQSGMQA